MIITIFIVGAAMAVLGIGLAHLIISKNEYLSDRAESTLSVITGIGITTMIVSAIIFFFLFISYLDEPAVAAKIKFYEEENAAIEHRLDLFIEEYLSHESDTFTDVSKVGTLALVSLPPELKSDEIINQQINTYLANQKKITFLKKEQIDLRNYGWWLFFKTYEEE